MGDGKRLAKYLADIAVGKPVNHSGLLKAWIGAGLLKSDINDLFDFSAGSGGPLRVVGPENFQRLIAYYGNAVDLSSKSAAAMTGSSHRFASSHSITLVCSQKEPHPTAVVSGGGGVITPRPIGRIGLIVENLELFVRFNETIAFCNEFTGLDAALSDSLEVIYGSGAAITGHPASKFLQTFEGLYCLPDMDAGGLEICLALHKRLPELNLSILFPRNLMQMLKSAGEPFTEAERIRLVSLAQIKLTSEPANILLSAGKKLEQEVYLV